MAGDGVSGEEVETDEDAARNPPPTRFRRNPTRRNRSSPRRRNPRRSAEEVVRELELATLPRPNDSIAAGKQAHKQAKSHKQSHNTKPSRAISHSKERTQNLANVTTEHKSVKSRHTRRSVKNHTRHTRGWRRHQCRRMRLSKSSFHTLSLPMKSRLCLFHQPKIGRVTGSCSLWCFVTLDESKAGEQCRPVSTVAAWNKVVSCGVVDCRHNSKCLHVLGL